ncbi:MAG: UDP-3-O-(3-hydroxymyristoyl)glucosamine N-acyltransferase [Burkholderiaceae bacterium]|nr:UDP-3-O-(3-hydroxymyristoyl)glucosamine N-acyltransferase [Burkholderiaceae bacterium]
MEKSNKLVIGGDSAFAEIAREYFDADSSYEVVGFTVEQAFLGRHELNGLPVVPFETLERHFAPSNHAFFAAVTYTQLNRLRARLAAQAKARGYALASYISPRAFVWRNVQIGEHCFVFEDNTVQPFVRIGENVVLWSGNHIGHHSTIEDHCFVSSHVVVSGFCSIGRSSFLGVNATLANNVRLGRDNWVGPNTVVMKDTADGALFKTEQPEPARVSAPRLFKVVA